MNTKQIIAIIAIAAVAIAAVGGAYAYTAELSNDGNDAPGQYLAITVDGTPVAKDYSQTFDAETLKFDTVTTWGDVVPGTEGDTQVITYTPYTTANNTPGDVDQNERHAGLISEMYGAIALQLGKTLTMKVDSINMDAGDFYTFTLKTTDLTGAAVALTGETTPVFVLYYTVDGIPNVIPLDDADGLYELFVTTDVKADTTVVAKLYALEVKSATLMNKADFRFDGITFTFNAEVDLTSEATHIYGYNAESQAADKKTFSTLTVKTKDDAQTPAEADVTNIIIKNASGALVIVPVTKTDTGTYTVELAYGDDYVVSAIKGTSRFIPAEIDISEAAPGVTVLENKPAVAILKTNPTVRSITKTDTAPDLDLDGMTVDVVFGTDVKQYSVVGSDGLGTPTCATADWYKTAGTYTISVPLKAIDSAETQLSVNIQITVTEPVIP